MIFSRKQRREAAKKRASEWQEQLQDFIDELFTTYFNSFVTSRVQYISNTTTKEPLRASFEENIVAFLRMKDKSATEALLASLSNYFKPIEKHFQHVNENIRYIFLPKHVSNKTPLMLGNNYKRLYGDIISALQETVFAVPKCSYSGIKRISDEVQKSLIDVLKHLDEIRQYYNLPAIFSNFADAETRLYQEIAKVDGFVHLPLRRLPTAALPADELAGFCVGRDALANRLARHIIKNDGVMLVAGYRGVGKSTFVNSVIAKLSDLEKQLGKSEQLSIVPIRISVAKISSGSDTSSVISVLRLCMRAIYHTFLVEEPESPQADLEKLLSKQEKYFLKWANLCAMRKVDMQWSESVTSLRHLEASLDLKAGDLLPRPLFSGIVGSFLPALGVKTNKEWNKRVEHTVSLLDYDEDRAEEDIVHLIGMLAKPGKYRSDGIKLIFVFDEMDKLDDPEISNLIKQLKNLFLAHHAVFILVTGKEFYYTWLKNQKSEDSMLSSYFSAVEMVPLFTSKDTVQLLLKCLFFIDGNNRKSPCLEELPSLEKAFIQTVAGYLTYRAKGLPREIIRELQGIQQWMPESLQSYITDRSDKENRFQIYAALQEVIESFASDTASDEWREQFNRGLYVLIEEFFRFKSVLLNTESGILKEIRERNFSLMPANEFKDHFEILISRLIAKDIYVSGRRIALFSKASDEGNTILTVAKTFYELTGRTADEQSGRSSQLSLEEITDRLKQDNLFRWKEAFESLRQNQATVTKLDPLLPLLYDIFITKQIMHNITFDQITEFRHSAASYLKNRSTFFKNVLRHSPDQFIVQEINEQLIQDFIQLIQEGVTPEDRHAGTIMLLGLLTRCRQEGIAKGNVPLHLSKDIFKDLISTLCMITEDDIFEIVINNLDIQKDISENLPALQGLANRFMHPFIDLLIRYDFPISDDVALQKLLEDAFNGKEPLNAIWELALAQRQKKLAQRIMIAIAQQWSNSDAGRRALLLWLESPDWNQEIDESILENAITTQNRFSFSLLKPLISSDTLKGKLSRILEAKTLPSLSPVQEQITQLATDKRVIGRKKWIITLDIIVMFVLLTAYFVVPFDLPAHVTLWNQFLGRFFESIIFFLGSVLSIIHFFQHRDDIYGTIMRILPALVCLWLLSFFVPVVTVWGLALLTILLIAFFVTLAFLYTATLS